METIFILFKNYKTVTQTITLHKLVKLINCNLAWKQDISNLWTKWLLHNKKKPKN